MGFPYWRLLGDSKMLRISERYVLILPVSGPAPFCWATQRVIDAIVPPMSIMRLAEKRFFCYACRRSQTCLVLYAMAAGGFTHGSHQAFGRVVVLCARRNDAR